MGWLDYAVVVVFFLGLVYVFLLVVVIGIVILFLKGHLVDVFLVGISLVLIVFNLVLKIFVDCFRLDF